MAINVSWLIDFYDTSTLFVLFNVELCTVHLVRVELATQLKDEPK